MGEALVASAAPRRTSFSTLWGGRARGRRALPALSRSPPGAGGSSRRVRALSVPVSTLSTGFSPHMRSFFACSLREDAERTELRAPAAPQLVPRHAAELVERLAERLAEERRSG